MRLGSQSPVVVDNLSYAYAAKSNRLLRVDDAAPGAGNGADGDFKDGTNAAATDDYQYDGNGNLTFDENKGIDDELGGIQYNYLNKPVHIRQRDGGTIEYVYDAAGAKLQKKVYQWSTSTRPEKTTVTTYIGSFIYEAVTVGTTAGGDELQTIAHEEGRIRVITPYSNTADPANLTGGGIDLPGGKQGVFDYYIKDNLSSIRAVITEEVNKASSVCTMEDNNTAVAQAEESLFGNASGNEVSGTRVSKQQYAPDWTSNTSSKVSRLQAVSGTPKTGPNVLLKVMAGDKISARADYYYAQDPGTSGNNGLTAFAQGLLSSLTGNKATAMAHDQAGAITTNLGSNADLQSFFTTQASSGNASAPKAYLNYVFLDEQFNFVGQSSGAQKVSQPGNGATPLQAANLVVPKNGYVYVYLSNESIEPVYFDNFTVSHQRSPLIEENHYYAYGLKIQAISSKAVASTLNPTAVSHGYQGSYAEEVSEFDLGYEEFDLRTYDPQLGRWTGVDPFDEFASPYVGMGGDPANNVDPSGGFLGLSGLASAAAGATIGGIIGGISDMISGRTDGGGFLMGMAIGSGGASLPGLGTLSSEVSVRSSAQAVVGASLNSEQTNLAYGDQQTEKEYNHGTADSFWPLFETADVAAYNFALEIGDKKNNKNNIKQEYSAIVYSVERINSKGEKQRYYSFTFPDYYTPSDPDMDADGDPHKKSPNIQKLIKRGRLPNDKTLVIEGHVHSHTRGDALGNDWSGRWNGQWGDSDMWSDSQNECYSFWLLTSDGILKKTGVNQVNGGCGNHIEYKDPLASKLYGDDSSNTAKPSSTLKTVNGNTKAVKNFYDN